MSRRMAFGRGRRRALLLVLFALIVGYALRFCPAARYVQLDVDQGDAAVVRRGRQTVLVDVGPADSYDALRYLRHEGLFVDTVVLSHLDEDHAGALLTLLRSEVEIGAVVMAEDAWEDASSAKVTAALELAREKGVPVRTCSHGDLIETAVVSFEVLSPDGSQEGSNERSLLLYARMEEVGLLLTGDLPASCEPGHVPDCDVLKVAHHGSKNATSDAFLAEASPRLALISVGAGNGYGHPTQRVLDSLAAIGADVLRTDRSGCVTLWLRDGTIRVRTMINPKAPS